MGTRNVAQCVGDGSESGTFGSESKIPILKWSFMTKTHTESQTSVIFFFCFVIFVVQIYRSLSALLSLRLHQTRTDLVVCHVYSL